jgi:hypothetical protein
MLRFDYMPSDFNPMFLFLGNSEELSALVALLRSFAENPKKMSFADELPSALKRARLVLMPAEAEFGMRPAVGGVFKWCLNAWQANRIAEQIELLARPENKSGSEIFEVGADGEIPVKVSKGEFTEDFLVRTI